MFRTPRSYSKLSTKFFYKYLFSESISTKLQTNDYILKTSIQDNFKQINFQKKKQIKGRFNLGRPIKIIFKVYSAPFWWWHLSGQCQIKFGFSEKHTKFEKIFLVVLTLQLICLVNDKTHEEEFFKLFVFLKKSELYHQ